MRVFCEKFSHSKKKHEKILEDFKANSSFLETSLKEKSDQITNLENQYKEKYESQQIKLSQEVAKANDKVFFFVQKT